VVKVSQVVLVVQDSQVQLVQLEQLEHLVPWVLANRDSLDLLDLRANVAVLVLMDSLVFQALLVILEQLEDQAPRASMVSPVEMDCQEVLVIRARMDSLDNLEELVLLVGQAQEASMVSLVTLVAPASLEEEDTLVQLDPTDSLVNRDLLAEASQVPVVLQAQPVPLAQWVHQATGYLLLSARMFATTGVSLLNSPATIVSARRATSLGKCNRRV
jgi:hypothetical protein